MSVHVFSPVTAVSPPLPLSFSDTFVRPNASDIGDDYQYVTVRLFGNDSYIGGTIDTNRLNWVHSGASNLTGNVAVFIPRILNNKRNPIWGHTQFAQMTILSSQGAAGISECGIAILNLWDYGIQQNYSFAILDNAGARKGRLIARVGVGETVLLDNIPIVNNDVFRLSGVTGVINTTLILKQNGVTIFNALDATMVPTGVPCMASGFNFNIAGSQFWNAFSCGSGI